MKVFITGGTGFIGSHVAMRLHSEGHEIFILARNVNKVPAFQTMERMTLIEGDCRDKETIEKCVAGMDAVIHFALCYEHGAVAMLLNDTLQSVQLFEAAANAGVKHFIYTSSTAGFGDFKPIMTEDMLSDSTDYYCATKASSERFLLATSYVTSMRCNIIRPGLTFGTSTVEGGPVKPWVVEDIVKKAKLGEDITMMRNEGTQATAASDIACTYSAVLNSDVNRQIYFAVSKNFVRIEDVAEKVIAKLGSKSKIVLTENIYGEKPRFLVPYKMERDFGLVFDGWNEVDRVIDYCIAQD